MKMTKRLLCVVAALACAVLPAMASAGIYSERMPTHSCRKPYKPYKFNSEWEVQNFKDEVDRYKRCLKDFVQDQKDAIDQHQEAANDAVDEWNRYAKYELS